ncbi:MAG: DUF2933 domain-containing protein [Gammaproteobacteria bacterium]|nr:DUF2933 domain-containing protein [Gammaproteobacteria bacterium]
MNVVKWIFWGFVVIAGFFLLAEHRAHLLGALPWLLGAAAVGLYWLMRHHHSSGARKP